MNNISRQGNTFYVYLQYRRRPTSNSLIVPRLRVEINDTFIEYERNIFGPRGASSYKTSLEGLPRLLISLDVIEVSKRIEQWYKAKYTQRIVTLLSRDRRGIFAFDSPEYQNMLRLNIFVGPLKKA